MAKHDPTRTTTKQDKAEAEFRARWRRASKAVTEYVEALPKKLTKQNSISRLLGINAQKYVFDISPDLLERISGDIEKLIQAEVGGDWLFNGYVGEAYSQGAAQAASTLTPQLKLIVPETQTFMPWALPAYRSRYELVKARVFEEIKYLSVEQANSLGGMLGRAILDGANPLEVAKSISQKFNIEMYKGERLARTEITMALKRARLDEGEALAEQYEMKVMFMHISAFAPTSRYTHMARHGELFTAEEVRQWYSVDGNAINCLCSMVEVLVNSDGEVIAKGLLERAEAIKLKYKDRIQEAE